MKNTAKTNSYNRGQVIQAAVIALFVACSGLSTQAAAVQIPEEALELDRWDLLAGDLGQPIYNNPEAAQINAQLINVKGEVAGTSAPLGKALQQTSIPSVPLQRVPLPGPATASLVSPVARNSDGELARSLETSVERETHRFSFGQSENCRRFELVCSLIGIP
jgi:hypothetical protein